MEKFIWSWNIVVEVIYCPSFPILNQRSLELFRLSSPVYRLCTILGCFILPVSNISFHFLFDSFYGGGWLFVTSGCHSHYGEHSIYKFEPEANGLENIRPWYWKLACTPVQTGRDKRPILCRSSWEHERNIFGSIGYLVDRGNFFYSVIGTTSVSSWVSMPPSILHDFYPGLTIYI